MQLSLWPTAQQRWKDLLDVARHADRTGWSAVYVWDHFMGDDGEFGPATTPTLETTAALAALGAATTSVEIGPLVLGNTYRHPAVVANWAATMDHITNGRFVLGLGAGWQSNEHHQYGIDLPPAGERVARLEEACTVIRSLLDSDRSTVEGQYYRLTDAVSEPKPVQDRLPLLVGGKGDRMLGVVARHADRWNMWGLPALIAQRASVLDRHCERIGRDPATIRRTAQALVLITDDPQRARAATRAGGARATYAGPVEGFVELVEQWRQVGVSEVIVPDMLMGVGSERTDQLDAIRAAVAA